MGCGYLMDGGDTMAMRGALGGDGTIWTTQWKKKSQWTGEQTYKVGSHQTHQQYNIIPTQISIYNKS